MSVKLGIEGSASCRTNRVVYLSHAETDEHACEVQDHHIRSSMHNALSPSHRCPRRPPQAMNPRRPGDQRFGLFHSGVLIQWARGPEAALAGQRGEEGKLRRARMIAQGVRGPEKRGMI
jgi:hypothetical protein